MVENELTISQAKSFAIIGNKLRSIVWKYLLMHYNIPRITEELRKKQEFIRITEKDVRKEVRFLEKHRAEILAEQTLFLRDTALTTNEHYVQRTNFLRMLYETWEKVSDGMGENPKYAYALAPLGKVINETLTAREDLSGLRTAKGAVSAIINLTKNEIENVNTFDFGDIAKMAEEADEKRRLGENTGGKQEGPGVLCGECIETEAVVETEGDSSGCVEQQESGGS